MNAQNWNTDWQFEAVQTGRSHPVTLPHDGMIHTNRDPSIRNYFLSAGFLGETYQALLCTRAVAGKNGSC